MITIKMKITGMDCASCVNDIEKVFNKKTGIKVAVSYITQSALFNYDENVWDESKIKTVIEKLGFNAN